MIEDKVIAIAKVFFGVVILIILFTVFVAINNKVDILSALTTVVQTIGGTILIVGTVILAVFLIIKGVEELTEF